MMWVDRYYHYLHVDHYLYNTFKNTLNHLKAIKNNLVSPLGYNLPRKNGFSGQYIVHYSVNQKHYLVSINNVDCWVSRGLLSMQRTK